jgi:hypothetical protein
MGLKLLGAKGDGAEDKVAGVSHDGAATRGDAVFREKKEKVGEELIDVIGALELSELSREDRAKVGSVDGLQVL